MTALPLTQQLLLKRQTWLLVDSARDPTLVMPFFIPFDHASMQPQLDCLTADQQAHLIRLRAS